MSFVLKFLMLVVSIFVIATSAIGIQYYNKCPALQSDKKMKCNRNFLIFMTVASVLMALVGLFLIRPSKASAGIASNKQSLLKALATETNAKTLNAAEEAIQAAKAAKAV